MEKIRPVMTSYSVRKQLEDYNNAISQLHLLNPSPKVIHLFNELRTFCCTTPLHSFTFERMLENDTVLRAICDNLCRLRSQYEYHLEMNWAKIYASNENQNFIEHFSEDGDYRRLIQLETDMLQDIGIYFCQDSLPNDKCTSLVTKVAFIGSGPIPISSILILSEYAPFIDIYNFDISSEANQLASIICERSLPSHLFKRMHFITQDVSQKSISFEVESILKECQLIFLAALVGHNEETKLNILEHIIMHAKNNVNKELVQHIIIRTTNGLCQVLYPKISAKSIQRLQVFRSYDINNNKKEAPLEIRSISPVQADNPISIIIAKMV